MREKKYPILEFNQYNSSDDKDKIIMFSADAEDLYGWAGIPRKGWQIRMLFQRPIKPSREKQLKEFWNKAANPKVGEDYILGPTAIVVAIEDMECIHNGKIDISYESDIDFTRPAGEIVSKLATNVLPKILKRLTREKREEVESFSQNPFETDFPEVENDYVLEFALQLTQMKCDAEEFFERMNVSESGQNEIIQSLEAISRPAIVVDGQHRLYGAASSDYEINLPVVALPNCPWTEQIYQFVVINEKAEKVEQSILTDIFGSSLTKEEQDAIRAKLSRANVEIESRIAAVIAGRDENSPFKDMVILKIDGLQPSNINPYVTDRTIRALIDGSAQLFSDGWRTNEEFYEEFVSPTISNRNKWMDWSGEWKAYWFTFWETIQNFYNKQASENKLDDVWDKTRLTNLTKAVTLREIQTLFMRKMIERMKKIENAREMLLSMGEDPEKVEAKISETRINLAIPKKQEEFKRMIISEFLQNGIPLKVFTANWRKSLDDSDGQRELWETLNTSFTRSKEGSSFHIRGRIFEASE